MSLTDLNKRNFGYAFYEVILLSEIFYLFCIYHSFQQIFIYITAAIYSKPEGIFTFDVTVQAGFEPTVFGTRRSTLY